MEKRFLKDILEEVMAVLEYENYMNLVEELERYISDKPIFATADCLPVLNHVGTKLWASRPVMAYSAIMKRWFDGSFQLNLETKQFKFCALQLLYESSAISDFTHWVEQLPRPKPNVKIISDNVETKYLLKEKDAVEA